MFEVYCRVPLDKNEGAIKAQNAMIAEVASYAAIAPLCLCKNCKVS